MCGSWHGGAAWQRISQTLGGVGQSKTHAIPPSSVKRVGQDGTFVCLLSVLESSQIHQFTIHEAGKGQFL